jgi:hypothetical protein
MQVVVWPVETFLANRDNSRGTHENKCDLPKDSPIPVRPPVSLVPVHSLDSISAAASRAPAGHGKGPKTDKKTVKPEQAGATGIGFNHTPKGVDYH